eukprot:3730168-Pleurochrysis_carterae.AAC.1
MGAVEGQSSKTLRPPPLFTCKAPHAASCRLTSFGWGGSDQLRAYDFRTHARLPLCASRLRQSDSLHGLLCRWTL